ncbi:MAG: SpaA isopeptide-forming pilin-related protein [Eubacteriales bacterium]|nr:SpaA isopeptide-forming pilin-related protein [Eubacteriales bacterium]
MKKSNSGGWTWGLILLLLLTLLPMSVSATGNNYLRIIRKSEYHQEIRGISYKIWRIGDHKPQLDESARSRSWEADRTHFRSMSLDELDAKYPPALLTEPTNVDGMIEDIELPDGRYYMRAVEKDAGGLLTERWRETATVFEVPLNDAFHVDVYPKPNVSSEPPGDIRLIKYSELVREENRMKGVTFELFRKNPGAKDISLGEYVTDERGEINVRDLPQGSYFFREKVTLPGYELLTKDIPVNLNDERGSTVEVVNNRPETGGKKFRKVDGDGSPLSGAVFKLLRQVKDLNGQIRFDRVIADGKEVTLISNEAGDFEVNGLAFGTYVLEETQVPIIDVQVYDAPQTPIFFEVTENSYHDVERLSVVNRKRPPEGDGPDVPVTGDIQIFLYAGIGGLLVLAGILYYRRSTRTISS